MKLSKVLHEYLLEISVKGYSKNTVETSSRCINQFIKFTGDIYVDEVTRGTVKRYIVEMQEHLKASTINHRLVLLDNLFSFALEEDFIEVNPMNKISQLKVTKEVRTTYSNDDVKLMLDSLKGKDYFTVRNKAIVTTLVETGIRASELCGIELEDVDGGAIRIRGKGNKVRYVPISKPLELQLLRYMRVRERFVGDAVINKLFVSKHKVAMNRLSLNRMILRLGESVGIHCTVHDFRRYYAQQMVGAVDLYTVQRLLGHSSIQATERYISGIKDEVILAKGLSSPLTRI